MILKPLKFTLAQCISPRFISVSSLHFSFYSVTCISDYRRVFGSVSRFVGYSLVVTTINYNTFKITVIITHK
jgi:hypothetical protein